MTDQLRADLEALYQRVDKGWCRYGPHQERCGENGDCLGRQMAHVVGLWQDGPNATERWYALSAALGFRRPWSRFENREEIPEWNDRADTSWQDVKDLVKEAIGQL